MKILYQYKDIFLGKKVLIEIFDYEGQLKQLKSLLDDIKGKIEE